MHFLSTCFWFFHRICITLFAVPRYIDLHMHMYTGPSRGCRASSARLVVPGQTDKNDVDWVGEAPGQDAYDETF